MAVATDSQRVKGLLPLRVPGHATTTVYVQVNVNERAALPAAIQLRASLEPEAAAQKTDRLYSIAWAVSASL